MRRFALLCHQARPSSTRESWKRTINRALDDDAEVPYSPGLETARLWAKILDKPPDYFVRPRLRKADREAQQLQAELRDAREQLRLYRERFGPL